MCVCLAVGQCVVLCAARALQKGSFQTGKVIFILGSLCWKLIYLVFHYLLLIECFN